MTKKTYTVEEVAIILNKHPESIRRLVREGSFGATEKGKRNKVLITEEGLMSYQLNTKVTQHLFIDQLESLNVASSTVWPALHVGTIYTFDELKTITDCPTIRGIRYRNNSPETSIITSLGEDVAKSQYNPYQDRFVDGILYYTGEGSKLSQKLTGGNLRLFEAIKTRHPIHVFQKLKVNEYVFCGIFTVIGYHIEKQPDTDNTIRDVFIFSLKPIINEIQNETNDVLATHSSEIDQNNLLERLQELEAKLTDEKISQQTLVKRYKRSAKLVNLLKRAYNYRCQLCNPNNSIPLIEKKDGTYYQEVHHISGFAETIVDSNDENDENFVIDHYNNVICCCTFHHKLLHAYKSKFIFDKSKFEFVAEDGSLTLPLYLRHEWHTFN